jgi:hypothetical protein
MVDLQLGKVVAIHPESHSIDVLILDNRMRLVDVPVLAAGAGTNTGLNDLPIPTPGQDPWAPVSLERDVYAVIAMMTPRSVCLGFIYPDVSQMMFEAGRRVQRHGSDVYTSVDDLGNVEVFHPSGTYMRIGTDPAHEDLTGKDYDARWAIKRNVDQPVHVQLQVKNPGAVKATVNIDPSGNVSLTCAGAYAVSAAGAMTIHSAASIVMTAPTIDLNP